MPPKLVRLAIFGAVGAATALAVVIAFVALGGGDDADRGGAGVAAASDPGPVHVHGLGINPADGALFIATHTGIYRVAKEAQKAKRVTDKQQDTMGFTVVGRDHFLGSGHPDLRDDLPPHLGLIESRDAGRTWRPISLLGEADFHVLRSVGKRIYGYDASNDRLLVSADGGATWEQRDRPSALLDLAANPANVRDLVASGDRQLYRSTDEGRTWTPLADAAGLLAWPRRDSLFLVDAIGVVSVSRDGGLHWVEIGQVGGQPAALLARSASELYVALHDGTVKQSRDGGRTWTIRSTP